MNDEDTCDSAKSEAWNDGYDNGKQEAQSQFRALLAEQRKEAEKELGKYGVSSFVYQRAEAKLELLKVLEEKTK